MNKRSVLIPVVEGYGEVEAVPVLLRRLLRAARIFDLDIGVPHRRSRSELAQEDRLRRIVEVARREPGCRGILVLLDADDDCPRMLRDKIEPWVIDAARGVPCGVVVPNREFEAWFLASLESLRGQRGISEAAVSEPSPEAPRNPKKALERWMATRAYKERTDQMMLAERFDLAQAYRRSRSFRRLIKVFGEILRGAGCGMHDWPPSDWT